MKAKTVAILSLCASLCLGAVWLANSKLVKNEFPWFKKSNHKIPDLETTSETSVVRPPTVQISAAKVNSAEDRKAETALRQLFAVGDFVLVEQLSRSQLEQPSLSQEYKIWLQSQLPTIKLG